MSWASGGPDTLQRNRNNLPDLLRTMPVKVSVKDGKISHQSTMGKRLERIVEVTIVDEREWILKHHPRRGSSTLTKDGFETCI